MLQRSVRSTASGLRGWPWIPIVILTALIGGAIFAPWIAPHSPTTTDLSNALRPPVWQEGGSVTYPLGTDKVGRDVLTRILYGGRVSLVLAISVILLGTVIGTTLGLVSGYRSGRSDATIQRGVEAVLALPTIVVALVFVYVVGQSLLGVILLLTPFVAAYFARMVRGEVLTIRRANYVALAQVAGASSSWIIRKHILPNVLSTVIVLASLQVGALILVEASLSFLGLGVPPPEPAWGLMVSEGRQLLVSHYWLTLFPGLAIVLTVLAINWIGDWLNDHLDPRRRGT